MLHRIRKLRADQGFTLIELLIVIVILGVLSGIVVFAVAAFNGNGKSAACKADKKNVEVAVEAYYAKTGAYPADIPALVPSYLKEAPPTDNYTITVNASTGAVSGAGGATTC